MTADRVAEAFRAHPRGGFLLPDQRPLAEEDRPLPLVLGQTSSQPSTVATMLRLLEVEPGHRVLDVGSGSGWTTALLGHLTGRGGRVVGVELVPELARWGADNVRASGDPAWVEVREATPGVLGAPDDAPFDRILVSAEAGTLPQELVEQLAVGGRMVVPVRGTMLTVDRRADRVDVARHGAYRFVPLR